MPKTIIRLYERLHLSTTAIIYGETKMNTMTIGIPENTVNFLFSLPDNEKINLAKRLLESISIKSEEVARTKDPFVTISGAWKDGRTVENTVDDMRIHRTFNRNMEEW